MTDENHTSQPKQLTLPNVPVIILGANHATWLTPDGEIRDLSFGQAAQKLTTETALYCHGKNIQQKLGLHSLKGYDILELFAFVRPAQFCLPTVKGVCEALKIDIPEQLADQAMSLIDATALLLEEVMKDGYQEASDGAALAYMMGRDDHAAWSWSSPLLNAYGIAGQLPPRRANAAFEIWKKRDEWEEEPPEAQTSNRPIAKEMALFRLKEMLAAPHILKPSEERLEQAAYAEAVTPAFAPRSEEGSPNIILAEAGTGVGKTLGYLAPASIWSEENQTPLWVSTFTRNLQHQIDEELNRLYPDPAQKNEKVVIRKGRENYLCLLNLEEAARTAKSMPQYSVTVGLMARWAAATRDGDLQGGDFPGWLVELIGRKRSLSLADRRGECVYAACPHYKKCYIEHSIRKARKADLIIANHALILHQAALGSEDAGRIPSHYVFDEGHHLFSAADNAFSAEISGLEGSELRRWLLGAENSKSSRARGLAKRLEDLIIDDEQAQKLLNEALRHARALPSENWTTRLHGEATPKGPAERFLQEVRSLVYARSTELKSPYSLEISTEAPTEALLAAAEALDQSLTALFRPIDALRILLQSKLDRDASELNSDTRRKIEAMTKTLKQRVCMTVNVWQSMLRNLTSGSEKSTDHIDWFGVERSNGHDLDVGMHRHWIDPTVPLAATLGQTTQGMVITSATLTDQSSIEQSSDHQTDWEIARQRTGASHFLAPPQEHSFNSPFNYPDQTKLFVITDVNKKDALQVASAYRELFLAAQGGALGLFTAIARLKSVYKHISSELEENQIPLYAQHIDAMDATTLIDIFRGEEHSCLLGTDAVRDGVDVPGNSLRMIVFDRVPWQRPDILHKARKSYFGGRLYDDLLVRLKLKQAFGRLVRRSDDRGVFVLLDPSFPSRLCSAFPEGVEVERIGLAEALEKIRDFYGHSPTKTEAASQDAPDWMPHNRQYFDDLEDDLPF